MQISADVFGSLPSDVVKNEQAWKDVCSMHMPVCLSVHLSVGICTCMCACICMCFYCSTYFNSV